ncbi:hypothetical protein C1T17_00525 [Sphingobium sp. SCG-1]|nr:hypothetical protein C1T17_00525 [Sphingobium sp. SCG-1]
MQLTLLHSEGFTGSGLSEGNLGQEPKPMYLTVNNLDLNLSLNPNSWIGSHKAGTILGSIYNDVFYGISGDRMYGGSGDDHYYVWDQNYSVTEYAGQGIDTLYSYAYTPITLSANVENLVLAGAGAKMGFGNGLNNIITAGSVGAYMNAGKGNDVLVGGAGMDTMVVKAGEGSDTVYNFTSGKDLIRLDGFDIGSFKNLMAHATQQGSDVHFDLGNGEELMVRGATVGSFKATDFAFLNDSAIVVDTPASRPTTGQNTLSGTHAGQTSNGWYAINNAWNSASLKYGTDYTNSVSYTYKDLSKGTTFNWDFPTLTLAEGAAGNVLAYPDLLFGASPFSGGTNPGDKAQVFPVQISKLNALTADFDVAFNGDTSGFNVAFDIWLTNKPGGDASTVTNEIMVWLHKGNFEAFGDKIGTYQDGDFVGTIYRAPGTHYTAIVANSDTPVGKLDMVKLFDTLIEMGIVSKDEYLAMSQLGAEVVSGSGTLTINHLAYDVQTTNSDGTIKTQHVTGTGTTTQVIDPVTEIEGTNGADVLEATATKSIVHALDGNDTLIASNGTNTLFGGKGHDTYVLHSSSDVIVELANEGIDTVKAGFSYALTDHVENLILTGKAAIDGVGNALDNMMTGNDAANKLEGGAGDDRLEGNGGADILVGGEGFDFATYTSAAQAVKVDMLTASINTGDAKGDVYMSIEGVIGSAFNDWIAGDHTANKLMGGDGDDYLAGRGGNDLLIGGRATTS